MEEDKCMTGIVMDIQKFCLHDGPGIRTTVFLKGCNMNCKWCHNPESIELEPTLMFTDEKCVKCRICEKVCSEGVHSFENKNHIIDRSKCKHCGKCVDACMNQALDFVGEEYTVEQIMAEIIKDEKYYITSNGGVTFSGGEATMQFEFLLELMRNCKERSYSVVLETNGIISEERLLLLLEYTDLFLLDYKVTGADQHIEWTGVSNKMVYKTLERINSLGGSVILRCPIIPGVNDTDEHFREIRKLKQHYGCVKQVEIIAYHDTGKGKWEQCGKIYEFAHLKTVTKEQKEVWESKIYDQMKEYYE